jgi:hypothetical protein
MKRLLPFVILSLTARLASAHYAPGNEYAITNVTLLPTVLETKGPVPAPAALIASPDLKVSGQGFWKFVAARDCVPSAHQCSLGEASARHHYRR